MSHSIGKKQILHLFRDIMEAADIRVNGDRPWDMKVHNEATFDAVAAEGTLGLGEAYMNGWWDAEALDEYFFRLTREVQRRGILVPSRFLSKLIAHLINLQSKARSKKVAEEHYDLGNDFYEAMLDPYMQYTCAYWKDATTLAQAQEAKLDLVCRKLYLKPGDRVLELGCGWGGFARFAAERYGCEVVAYNISKEQVAYAREKTKGLPVTIVLKDYREAEGLFDKVVSIGMTEHIGHKNYGTFYEIVRRCLKEDSIALQHTIGNDITKVTSDPWFTKYIFPGGLIPSMHQLSGGYEGNLTLEDFHNFGAYYDPTLMHWYANFKEAWPRFKDQYGDRFYRMWSYYLLSCAGAFRSRSIHLWQLVFSKSGLVGGYTSQR